MTELRIATLDGGERTLAPEVLGTLSSSLRGRLLAAGDPDYDGARRVWNGMHDRRPALIVQCEGTGDVIDAVKFARAHGLLISVRGGGHNVAGTSVTNGGMMIDLSPMRGIRVDPDRRTASVQPGATWADVDRETQAFGLVVPGGNISTTGVAGLTLGGGMGWLRRKLGLSCDNLLAADIVTADGRFHSVSASREQDLFWAIRGGGGNFGIVTAFEFRLHPLGPTIMFAAPLYPVEAAADAIHYWRRYCAQAPDEVSSYVFFMTIPHAPEFPEALWGRQVVALPGVYCGHHDDGEHALAPLRRFDQPLLDLSGRIPYTSLQQTFDWMFPTGHYYYWKTANLRSLDDDVVDVLVECGTTRSSPGTVVGIWQLGGAIARLRPDDSAYPRRHAPYLVNIDSAWTDGAETSRHVAWTRETWHSLQPFSDGGMYLHYGSLEEEAQVRVAYGANYDRLVGIKHRYDPDNFFRLNQNIRPTPTLPALDSIFPVRPVTRVRPRDRGLEEPRA